MAVRVELLLQAPEPPKIVVEMVPQVSLGLAEVAVEGVLEAQGLEVMLPLQQQVLQVLELLALLEQRGAQVEMVAPDLMVP